jgi:hypothetical protein
MKEPDNKLLILFFLIFIHIGEYNMRKDVPSKTKSYAIALILIGTICFPFFTVYSTASNPSSSIRQNPVDTSADETEYWALLVAVGVYAENPEQDRPDMLLEVDDFHELLLQSDWWKEDHIKVIKAEEATVPNIIAGLRWLDRKEDRNDISLVFFSTHGNTLGIDIPPKDEADGSDEALVSYWGFVYDNTILWDDEINVLLNRLESKGVCLIVDSCYAGGFNDPPNWLIKGIMNQKDRQSDMTAAEWVKGFGQGVLGQKRVVLMGSCEDELSYSGGFAPYLIDGFRGYGDTNSDGIISAEEAFYYAQPRSSPHQNPTIYDGYEGDLPLMNIGTNRSVRNEQLGEMRNRNDIVRPASLSAETAALCGYIKEANTTTPIENAHIEVRGRINDYEYYENQTTTDPMGFYQMCTPGIRLRITISAEGYCNRSGGPFQMTENETKWVNLSLYPRPPETAIVCGYITDEATTSPLEMANVSLYWQGSEQQYYQNQTTSEINGYYQINVAAGTIILDMDKEGYFSENIEQFSIEEYQTVWVNVSLYPRPAENAVICGYLTDGQTGAPFNGTQIEFDWWNVPINQEYRKEAQTDATGFYTIDIAPGEVYMDIREHGHEFYDPYRHDAVENSTTWYNYSLLSSTVEIELLKPLKALYVNNERIIPLSKTRIIGPIDIGVTIPWGWGEQGFVERMEFSIDDVLQETITSEPYNWTWTQRAFGKHVIKIVAYDYEGDSTSKEIEVWKFL